jgi:hypothetical protein
LGHREEIMELMGEIIEADITWMKFTDLMIETGVISDWIENGDFHKTPGEAAKK